MWKFPKLNKMKFFSVLTFPRKLLRIHWKDNQAKYFCLLPEKFGKKNIFEEKTAVRAQANTEQDQAEKEKRATSKSKMDFSRRFVCLLGEGVIWKWRIFRRKELEVFNRQLRNHFLRSVIIQNVLSWDFIVAYSLAKLHFLGHINLLWVVWEKKTKVLYVFWTMVFYRNLLPLGNIKFVSKFLLILNSIRRGTEPLRQEPIWGIAQSYTEIKKLDFTEPL